jgi:hypothetical protein
MGKDDSDQDLLWANLIERGYDEVEDDFAYKGGSVSMTMSDGVDYVTLRASEENQLEEVVLNFNSDEYNQTDLNELDPAIEYFQETDYLEFYGEKEDFRVGINPEETEDIVEATMETMDHLSVEGVNTLLSNGKREQEEEA